MVSRLLLAFAALMMGVGGSMHATAFGTASAQLNSTAMPPLFTNSFKVLWLADSTTMVSLMLIFGLIAARPHLASRPLVALLALIPAAIGVLIYLFVGNFFAGHMLVAAAAAVLLAAALLP